MKMQFSSHTENDGIKKYLETSRESSGDSEHSKKSSNDDNMDSSSSSQSLEPKVKQSQIYFNNGNHNFKIIQEIIVF